MKTKQVTPLEVAQQKRLEKLLEEKRTAYLRGWKDGYDTAKSDFDRDGLVE